MNESLMQVYRHNEINLRWLGQKLAAVDDRSSLLRRRPAMRRWQRNRGIAAKDSDG